MDVSVIIVNYNTKSLTRDCLKSVFERTQGISFEVIVSDNGSTDGSQGMIRAEFPEVVLIENGANLGFGAANNRALAVTRGKYVLYLNSDTVLLNNAVKMFFDYWENSPEKERIGALGGVLLNENMETIHSGGRFPTFWGLTKILIRDIVSQMAKSLRRLFCRKEYFLIKHSSCNSHLGNVDYVTGADLFVKNDENARFDENFFLYYEETDLQKRMELKGLRRVMIDGPRIVHLEGASNKSMGKKFTSFGNLASYVSMVYYCKKNISKTGAFFLKILVTILWLNPMHLKYTKQYFKRLYSV